MGKYQIEQFLMAPVKANDKPINIAKRCLWILPHRDCDHAFDSIQNVSNEIKAMFLLQVYFDIHKTYVTRDGLKLYQPFGLTVSLPMIHGSTWFVHQILYYVGQSDAQFSTGLCSFYKLGM